MPPQNLKNWYNCPVLYSERNLLTIFHSSSFYSGVKVVFLIAKKLMTAPYTYASVSPYFFNWAPVRQNQQNDVRSAKTQISLGICLVWSFFAECTCCLFCQAVAQITVTTVIILNFSTGMSVQTVLTLIWHLLEEQSEQDLHCLPFLHFLDSLLYA